MNWQCRLYGHQWRHPGSYEVVLVDGVEPSYPFECAVCGHELYMDANGTFGPNTGGRVTEDSDEPTVPDAELTVDDTVPTVADTEPTIDGTDPELESTPELEDDE